MSGSPDRAAAERAAMVRALELALEGWGRVSPNPLVGAVLLKDGRVVAEAAHAEFGAPHAEVVALSACDDTRGATCVVNLEPCAHSGKTPPCADALIEAGVSRVVYAVDDSSAEAGGGAEKLKAAGIEVEAGLMREEASALNAQFLWARRRTARPFIALKVATSLDGLLADESGQSQWISGDEARDHVQWLRAGFDSIAVGRRTVAVDDPQLTVRGELTPRVPPVRVILSKSGMVHRDLAVVRSAKEVRTIVVTGSHTVERTEKDLAGSGVEVVAADGLLAVLGKLRELGLVSVLVEGGGSLAGALLEAHLVDRIYWIQAPLWLGVGVPAFGDRAGLPLEDSKRWIVTERRPLGPDTLLVVDRELCSPES